MRHADTESLNRLRLAIFENATSLHSESELLLRARFFARAYLLAYFACEELGKLPIIVGAMGQVAAGKPVDWARVTRRFRSHQAKTDSDDFHHYVFGVELDLLADRDVEWLDQARSKSQQRVGTKNDSTYVDCRDGSVISPLASIEEGDANAMVARAAASLRAHAVSEELTNPFFRKTRATM